MKFACSDYALRTIKNPLSSPGDILSSWAPDRVNKSHRLCWEYFMWQVHLGIIHFNNEFYARTECQRRKYNCCQKWGFLSRSPSTAGLQQPDLGSCTTQAGEITVSFIFVSWAHPAPPHPLLRAISGRKLPHQDAWLSVIQDSRLGKTRWLFLVSGDSSQSQYRVMRHSTINISSPLLSRDV